MDQDSQPDISEPQNLSENIPQEETAEGNIAEEGSLNAEEGKMAEDSSESKPEEPAVEGGEAVDGAEGSEVKTDEPSTEIKEEGDETTEAQPVEEPVPPKPEEPKIDPEQCRVCTSKEELGDIFQLQGDRPVAAIIKLLCPTLNISERDSLPHKICNGCLEKVSIAYSFKQTAEITEREFRSKLKRSQNKKRTGASDYVLIDAKVALLEESSEDDEEIQDDDEFRVSKTESEVSDDDLSDFEPKKKKKKVSRKKKKPQKSTPKSSSAKKKKKTKPTSTTKSSGSSFKANVVYIEAPGGSDDSEDERPIKKRKRTAPTEHRPEGGLPCPQCDRVLANSHGLREHLKSHSTEKFTCKLCSKQFKLKLSLDAHMARHNEEKARAEASKNRAARASRPAPKPAAPTPVKKATPMRPSTRPSVSVHKKEMPKKRDPEVTGRDLFKTCAPLSSTYWSDSFSD